MKPFLSLVQLPLWSLIAISAVSHTDAAPGSVAGHWEGAIRLPTVPLAIRVDLAESAGGKWEGTIDIPVQGLRGFKLDPVSVEALTVRFAMPGIPGEPAFDGKVSADGQVIAGEFTQGGQKFDFRIERKARTELAGETPSRGVPGQGLAGFWQGSLKPMPVIELRLALELTNNAAGEVGGLMVSMDQGGAKIPITTLTQQAGSVHLETAAVGGAFDGKLSEDGSELAGDWKQGGQTTPLVFKRLAKAPQLRRPQEPAKPYPYIEEEVQVRSAGGTVTLAGTLTLPRGQGPFPGVVLITGSGPQDRDEAIMGHRPFLVLADHLTREGIAVLRCDDRGIGKSGGNFATATVTNFVEDTLAAFEFLRSRPEIDPKRVGLLGHSEGGIVAPLAATRSTNVAFVVLMAGVGVPVEELLVQQGRDISRVMGLGEEMVSKNAESQRRLFSILKTESDPKTAEEKVKAAIREQMALLTEEQRRQAGLSESALNAQVRTVLSPWFRQLLVYDPRPALEAVKCPLLALNGEKDLQVAAKPNLDRIREALAAGNNARVKTVELAGLNHLFQQCETGAIAEYGTIEETLNPVALRTISAWILETVSSGGTGRK